MRSIITAIGTAVPENKIPQSQIFEFMARAHDFEGKDKIRLQALYRATGIKTRHSVISDYGQLDKTKWSFYPQTADLRPFPSTQTRSEIYKANAAKLSAQAVANCFAKTEIGLSEITHLITISCTGMYAPGLDIDLINMLDLNPQIQRTCINFMGCYAAITGIRTADAFCKADPNAKVLIVATELCTIHFQNKPDEDNLLANAIFSDGSAAFLMTAFNENSSQKGLSPLAFHTEILNDGGENMAWNIGDFGFEMKLSSYVPSLVESGIKSLTDTLKNKLREASITQYAIHPGGKRILEVIESELKLSKEDNRFAYEVLKEYGNMSSATLLFVLEKIMASGQSKNEQCLSVAFGPGLTLESMVLESV
ncbi:MAG: type III polyketide synthase [Cytophagales bacterium CG12_big_fil_rev_8_21_14_0_65_40_12]|nr:MAG: type III polyketide synthase [Cytophagales bacterium CG12_big_fil_rev_8_21_14_0_65_40_12]PIW05859.1 MAG: type III polyketide synthase [Cytophagales bacterium CG17_big_fil_post_rev_8_21_14_2_50_40_13]